VNAKRVVSLIRDAAADLKTALAIYWPAIGRNEMAEANALGAVARAFSRRGFHVFHEVHCRTGSEYKGRVDLLAVSTDRLACVAVEAKRVYNPERAREIVRDWDRLGVTILASEYGAPTVRPDRHYRLVVATSWQPTVHNWWLGDASPAWPEAPWRAATHMDLDYSGAEFIQDDGKWGKHWLLYAFGERGRSYFR
jgi:hypothetical protein